MRNIDSFCAYFGLLYQPELCKAQKFDLHFYMQNLSTFPAIHTIPIQVNQMLMSSIS